MAKVPANPNKKFRADVKKFANLLEVNVGTALKRIALEVFRGVVLKTPVDSGMLRANWVIGINQRRESDKTIEGKIGKVAARSIALQEMTKLGRVKATDTIIISNTLPYAEVVEYGMFSSGPNITGGFSRQAPAGMVRLTLQEVRERMEAIKAGLGSVI